MTNYQEIKNASIEEKEKFLLDNGWYHKEYYHHTQPDRKIKVWFNDALKLKFQNLPYAILNQYHHEEELQIQKEFDNFTRVCLCNKCSGELQIKDSQGNNMGYYGLVEAEVGGGYYSPHLMDMQTYKFNLCEKCLFELFKTFQIPVETQDSPLGF